MQLDGILRHANANTYVMQPDLSGMQIAFKYSRVLCSYLYLFYAHQVCCSGRELGTYITRDLQHITVFSIRESMFRGLLIWYSTIRTASATVLIQYIACLVRMTHMSLSNFQKIKLYSTHGI